MKDLHKFVFYIVDEAAATRAWSPFYSSGYFSSSAMQKWWGNEWCIISLSENLALIQEKTRDDVFHNQIHNWIKFNFYGSVSPCLSFRNVDGEEEELSICLQGFNLQSMRQRWRQVHVAGLVSAAMLSGGVPCTIQWQHLQKLWIWRKLVDVGRGGNYILW